MGVNKIVQAKKTKDVAVEEIPTIVKIKPGTAAEKSIRFKLPNQLVNGSIDSVINHALGLAEEDGITKDELRYIERIKTEMRNKYGILVNNQAVDGKGKLSQYLRETESPGGRRYFEAQIIVAARQEGANSLDYRVY